MKNRLAIEFRVGEEQHEEEKSDTHDDGWEIISQESVSERERESIS
jgi:hypothetical protein